MTRVAQVRRCPSLATLSSSAEGRRRPTGRERRQVANLRSPGRSGRPVCVCSVASRRREGGGSRSAASTSEKNVPKRYVDLVSRPENERFDEAFVSLEGGAGGRGEVWKKRSGGKAEATKGRGRLVKNFKYKPGGQQAKKIFLAAEAPANGTRGASVFIEADENCDDLLHLHARYHYKAKDGGNASPATAAAGGGGRKVQRSSKPLIVKVPVGTTVIASAGKGKGGSPVELMRSGERILVARGGEGGLGAEEPSSGGRHGDPLSEVSVTANRLDWQKAAKGKQGDRVSVHLVLRVKADIGLVGLPNAGKSTLLSAITRAKPEIANYPFTTLVPNLGVIGGSAESWKERRGMKEGGGEVFAGEDDWGESGGEGFDFDSDAPWGEAEAEARAPYEESALDSAVVADLPGLIGDAHKGKGLGRNFLRHLKRTRMICHLVDISNSTDPFSDYIQIREELRMYNPDYIERKPHIVVFTKCDLLEDSSEGGGGNSSSFDTARALLDEKDFVDQIGAYYGEVAMEVEGIYPTDVVYLSSKTGEGMPDLVKALTRAFADLDF